MTRSVTRSATRIEVTHGPDSEPQRLTVILRDGAAESRHEVTLHEADRHRLAGEAPAGEVVEAAFRFLLAREPKESILARFDLMVIGRYFPEFEAELPSYLPR